MRALSFVPCAQVGCLYVDSKSLRNDLMPITLNTLDKIKLLLLQMSRDTCFQVCGARSDRAQLGCAGEEQQSGGPTWVYGRQGLCLDLQGKGREWAV